MAESLRGAPVAKALTEKLISRVEALKERGVTPKLAIIRVGEREDDLSYERGATNRCGKVGVEIEKFLLPADCTQDDLMATIAKVNADDSIHGCLMFRPLPRTLDELQACGALDPAKDVDCITDGSLAGVVKGQANGFPPCTAEAVIEMLDYYGVELHGAVCTVVGCSLVIGKPVALMLQSRDATVTMSHIFTRDVPAETRRAEVVVVATGHPCTVSTEGMADGQVIIDVGINWDEAQGRFVGDVDHEAAEAFDMRISPVPGGVGSVTTAILVKHVVEAAERIVSAKE